MSNTPPTYSGIWQGWSLQVPTVVSAGMAAKNQAKADLLYQVIDSSDFYSSPVARAIAA